VYGNPHVTSTGEFLISIFFGRAGINKVISMSKILHFSTRSLGSEVDSPDPGELAVWASGRRGIGGDLTTFLLEQSLEPQVQVGIDRPCAGGVFYRDRWLESLVGIREGVITGEMDSDPSLLRSDVEEMLKREKNLWFAIPAPHLFGFRDAYYDDEEEASRAVLTQVKRLMRAMRDERAGGHVVICDRSDPVEFETLAMKKCLFFQPDPGSDDLAALLEYQRTIAVKSRDLPLLIGLMAEYQVKDLVVVNPEIVALQQALLHFDPEHITAGGYCTSGCQEYWENVAGSASYPLDSTTEMK
jgi:hypothetical protein